MTIDEWYQIELDDLANFVQNWKDENARDPDTWPLDMPQGEWDEQNRSRLS